MICFRFKIKILVTKFKDNNIIRVLWSELFDISIVGWDTSMFLVCLFYTDVCSFKTIISSKKPDERTEIIFLSWTVAFVANVYMVSVKNALDMRRARVEFVNRVHTVNVDLSSSSTNMYPWYFNELSCMFLAIVCKRT